jgi:hypothetical protein
MKSPKVCLVLCSLAALLLACDLPFLSQEKTATFVETTSATPNADSNPSNANATPEADSTIDANATANPSAVGTRRPAAPRTAPAVYVSSIRIDPPQPRSGPNPVTFYVRFQSTFPNKQTYKWLVKIFRPGDNKSFGETAAMNTDIPPGASEIASANNWHTNPYQCESFTARVFYVESGVYADPIEFKKTDGVNTPFVDFKVCP